MDKILKILKPLSCYKQYYVIEKLDTSPCKCILKCKYKPPKELAYITNKINNKKTHKRHHMSRK